MCGDVARLSFLALAVILAAGGGCTSTAEITRQNRPSRYPPDRLLAIGEVFEQQGDLRRADALYTYVQQTSPQFAQNAANHLYVLAQRRAGEVAGQQPATMYAAAEPAGSSKLRSPSGNAAYAAAQPADSRNSPLPSESASAADQSVVHAQHHQQVPPSSGGSKKQSGAPPNQKLLPARSATEGTPPQIRPAQSAP